MGGAGGEPSSVVAERVGGARGGPVAAVACNAALPAGCLDDVAPLTTAASRLPRAQAARSGQLGACGLHRVGRVARTLADLAGAGHTIGEEHVCLALDLRAEPLVGELVASGVRRRPRVLSLGASHTGLPPEAFAAASPGSPRWVPPGSRRCSTAGPRTRPGQRGRGSGDARRRVESTCGPAPPASRASGAGPGRRSMSPSTGRATRRTASASTCSAVPGYPVALADDNDPPVRALPPRRPRCARRHACCPSSARAGALATVTTSRASSGATSRRAGVGVVSGLALGIDGAAHRGARRRGGRRWGAAGRRGRQRSRRHLPEGARRRCGTTSPGRGWC